MKIYENAISNYKSIKSMYPVWYPNIYEMDSIWRVMGEELDLLRADTLKSLDNQFISTSDSETITKLEEWMGLTTDLNKGLADRRAIVLSSMNGFGHIGQREIEEYVNYFTSGTVNVEFNPGGHIDIYVTREINDTMNILDAAFVLGKRIPAHLRMIWHDVVTTQPFMSLESFSLYSIEHVQKMFYDGTYLYDGTITYSGGNLSNTYFDSEYEFGNAIDFTGTVYKPDIEILEESMYSTITNKRLELLSAATRGEITLAPVTEIAFGDGATAPTWPDRTQTSLVNELARYPVDSYENTELGVSRIKASIPQADLAGKEISEAGLYDSNGNLVAVKNMAKKYKDENIGLTYTFDDKFDIGNVEEVNQ